MYNIQHVCEQTIEQNNRNNGAKFIVKYFNRSVA